MDYNEIKNNIEDMATINYRDFVKAIISFDKGINDEETLDTLYERFMEDDSMTLLNEDFDEIIDELNNQE